MTKEIAIKVAVTYLIEKKVAEKARTCLFWLNPVFSRAYNGNWKTVWTVKSIRSLSLELMDIRRRDTQSKIRKEVMSSSRMKRSHKREIEKRCR